MSLEEAIRRHREDFQAALSGAFGDWDSLRELVECKELLDGSTLAVEVGGKTLKLRTVVMEVFDWVDARGKLEVLLRRAVEQRPNRQDLRNIAHSVGATDMGTSSRVALLRALEAQHQSVPPDPRILATVPHCAVSFVHDYNLPQAFVARESELVRLSNLLVGKAAEAIRARVVAVTAIGGVGKSCLCRAFLERPEVAASFSRVVWFSFYEARVESEDYFLAQILSHVYQSEPPGDPSGGNDTKRLRRALADALNRERTLLVLDGLEVVQFTDNPDSAKYGEIKPMWAEVEKLLRSVLNSSQSACLITSRVPLRALEPVRGYQPVSLDLFAPTDGATILQSLGVKGTVADLLACAVYLGGHALSLVAAGRFLARRQVSAGKLAELVGDLDVFARTTEGEKVKQICEWYRSELSTEQAYFLTRLAVHGRSVTAANFPATIMSYGGSESDREAEEQIIQPLVDRGLVDRLESSDSIVCYSAHPLMKLAYSTWLEPAERKRSHEEWARAAATAPGRLSVSGAKSVAELQPLVDAIEHYLAADNWREAWKVYSDRGVGSRLGQLGYFERSLDLAKQFEKAQRAVEWDAREAVYLFDRLAWLSGRLERDEDELNYRRAELAAARTAHISELDEVKSIVAAAFVRSGFVREAAAIQPKDKKALGSIALAQGRYKRAAELLRVALKEAYGHGLTVAAQPLAEALYRAGELQDAGDVLDNALKVAVAEGFTCCQQSVLWQLAELALRRGDVADAGHWREAYAVLCRQLELDPDEHSWLLLEQGDITGALAAAAEVPGNVRPSRNVAQHVAKARILLRTGDRVQAIAELDAAELVQSSTGYKQLKNDIAQLRKELVLAPSRS